MGTISIFFKETMASTKSDDPHIGDFFRVKNQFQFQFFFKFISKHQHSLIPLVLLVQFFSSDESLHCLLNIIIADNFPIGHYQTNKITWLLFLFIFTHSGMDYIWQICQPRSDLNLSFHPTKTVDKMTEQRNSGFSIFGNSSRSTNHYHLRQYDQ